MIKYFYNINADIKKQALCELEMEALFKTKLTNNYIISQIKLNPNTSQFIKSRIDITFETNTLELMLEKIQEANFCADNFKIEYSRIKNDNTTHATRIDAQIKIANSINGIGVIKNPEITFAICNIDNTYYFGKYIKNDFEWHKHNQKPFSYCNAMDIDLSRSIVNIAAKNNKNTKIIDPCCGIGTVVMEGLSLGYNITGSEICRAISYNAVRNLEHYNYPAVIKRADIHDISKDYDVAIIDIPYGLMSNTDNNKQLEIIKSAKRIANEVIIISSTDISKIIIQSNLKITNSIIIAKKNINSFKRNIYICEN
jgi:tRNA (guanine10-N2)-dimethyltransferase